MTAFHNLVKRFFSTGSEPPEPDKLKHLWSISIYGGKTPLDLNPLPLASHPVLTRENVTDVPALFVADPFMVLRDNRWYMFFEVLNGATKRGEIGLASSDDCLKWNYEQIVLREAFHLSYPSVFEWKHEYYMLPESHKASAVRLYKARSFPFEWELAGTLLQGEPFADASLYYNDLWWLFTEVSPGRTHDMLRLYYSKDLMGPWAQHPFSPVVEKTPYLARPAGRVVEFDGRIYRFAQVCSPEYGLRVNTLHVQELTPDKYAEELVEANPALGPSGTGWNQHGMHHVDAHRLNSGEWIACVDGWRAVQNSAYMKPLWRR